MKQSESIPILVIMVIHGCSSYAELSEYDYDEYNEVIAGEAGEYEYGEQAVTSIPRFLSQSTYMDVDEGESFSLPCFVTKMDDYVLMWMRNEEIISLGNQILNNEGGRYTLQLSEQGNNLVVNAATPSDRGTYYCQVSSFNLANIHHTVNIRVQPVIETVPHGQVSLQEGDSAKLFCYLVAGEPRPEVLWMIRNAENDTEHLEQELELTNVSRKHSGQYICLADNGFGLKPVSSEVLINVEYLPETAIHQVYLQSATGTHIYISCNVQSSPEARVTWTKNGQKIDPSSDRYSVNVDGNTHNLLLRTITSDSFGVYSCLAENSLGDSLESTHVSELGCWSTHQTEYLSETDLKVLADSGHIEGGNLLYGILCKHPFADLIKQAASDDEQLEEKELQQNEIVENVSSSSSAQSIDKYGEESRNPQPTNSPVFEIVPTSSSQNKENIVEFDQKEGEINSSVYSHEHIDNNDEVELRVYVLATDDNSSQLGSYNPDQEKTNNLKILSTESRTETVEILLPSDTIETRVRMIEEKENKKETEFKESQDAEKQNILTNNEAEAELEKSKSSILDVNDVTNNVKDEKDEATLNYSNVEKDYNDEENKSNKSGESNSLLKLGINVDEDSLNKSEIERPNKEEQQNSKDGQNGDNKLSPDPGENEVDTHYGKAELGVHDADDATNSLHRNRKDGKSDTEYKAADPKLSDENDATMMHPYKDKVKEVKLRKSLSEDKVEIKTEESKPIMYDATNTTNLTEFSGNEGESTNKIANKVDDNAQASFNNDDLEAGELASDAVEPKIPKEGDSKLRNSLSEDKVEINTEESEPIMYDAKNTTNLTEFSGHEGLSTNKIANNVVDNAQASFNNDDLEVGELASDDVETKILKEGDSKPNISYIIKTKDKQEEPVSSIQSLVESYKSVQFQECKLWTNIVIENEKTIKMVVRESARDCHLDCQVTEGCLGWFFGSVGGLDSCVLYGCGQFKKMVQQDTVSCRIGDCVDGWHEELYSCKFQDYYRYVGEERFERIVQTKGKASYSSCEAVLLLWMTVTVLRLS